MITASAERDDELHDIGSRATADLIKPIAHGSFENSRYSYVLKRSQAWAPWPIPLFEAGAFPQSALLKQATFPRLRIIHVSRVGSIDCPPLCIGW